MTNDTVRARRPRRRRPPTVRVRAWPYTEPSSATILAGGWVAETMPDVCEGCADRDDVDPIRFPFQVRPTEPGWVEADYHCQVCDAEWWCGWSRERALRITQVSGGEMWERE